MTLTTTPKVIKTETEYEAALERLEEIFDAQPGTPEGDELELLALLIERYEEQEFPVAAPSPLEAIRFRMEQAGLKQKDLVPFIGSPSKVSEVLSGRRPLSIAMIRKLSGGLGIPADVLLQAADAKTEGAPKRKPPDQAAKDAAAKIGGDFPFTEMWKRGWFEECAGTLAQAKAQRESVLQTFFAPLGEKFVNRALNRQHVRSNSAMNECALMAWRARVVTVALRQSLPEYRRGSVTLEFLRELARLSYFDGGPKLAQEFLGKSGLALVIEPHLPKTFLDGAAIKLPNGAPLVALTLRYDRLDNFWFTLFHEVAHVMLHLDRDDVDAFFDDLSQAGADKCENEADALAKDALIPGEQWQRAALERMPTASRVRLFASEWRISPAIVAGRLRHETHDYTLLQELIGCRQVRRMFSATNK